VDGALFGVLVGSVIGLLTGWPAGGDWNVLGVIILSSVALVGAAVALGLLAHAIGSRGRAVLGMFVGAGVGAGLGAWLGRIDGLFAGILLGAAAGVALARATR
jgi:hypothetical protein